MIRIEKVKLKNFMSYKSSTIEFSNDLTIFVGDNGLGKSTILEAISFALFGEVSRKVNKRDLINIDADKKEDAYVELYTNTFMIHRDLKRGTSTYIDIFKTGERIETIQSVNEIVEKLLNADKNHFMNLFYIQQGKLIDIVEMSASERKKIFDKLFFSDTSFENFYNYFKTLEQTYAKSIDDTSENIQFKIKELKQENKKIRPKIKKLKVLIDDLILKIKEKQEELKNLNDQYNIYSQYKEKSLKLSHYKDLLSEIEILSDDEIESIKQEINEIEDQVNKINEAKKAQEIYKQLSFFLENWQLYSEYDHTKFVKELGKSKYNEETISLLKKSRKNIFNNHTSEYTEFESAIKDHESLVLSAGYNELFMKDESYLSKYNIIYTNYNLFKELQSQYDIHNRLDLENLVFKFSKYKEIEDVNDLLTKMSSLKFSLSKDEKNRKLQEKYLQEKNRLQQELLSYNLKTEEEDLSEQISLNNAILVDLMDKKSKVIEEGYELKHIYQNNTSEIELLTDKLNKILKLELLHQVMLNLTKLFHRDMLPSIYREIIYSPFKERLKTYISKFGFNINVDFDKKFNFITDQFNSIHLLSGGQKVVLSLAVRFSISDLLGLKLPFLLIDEPTQSLDKFRVDEMVNVVEQLSKHFQIILVTHNDKFLDSTGKIYHLESRS